jgi:hypothetical protein
VSANEIKTNMKFFPPLFSNSFFPMRCLISLLSTHIAFANRGGPDYKDSTAPLRLHISDVSLEDFVLSTFTDFSFVSMVSTFRIALHRKGSDCLFLSLILLLDCFEAPCEL